MFMAPAHERRERVVQGVTTIEIVDGQKADKAIALYPAKKIATIVNLKTSAGMPTMGKTFVNLRERIADSQSGKGGKAERLGIETIDHAQPIDHDRGGQRCAGCPGQQRGDQ
jgi:hypothetical protein